eukprot:scaffold18163_cov55-Attheya_sp.AAC.3
MEVADEPRVEGRSACDLIIGLQEETGRCHSSIRKANVTERRMGNKKVKTLLDPQPSYINALKHAKTKYFKVTPLELLASPSLGYTYITIDVREPVRHLYANVGQCDNSSKMNWLHYSTTTSTT